MTADSVRAVVILGCRVSHDRETGLLVGALARRVRAGAVFAREQGVEKVVVAGGKAWGGWIEADAMARDLERNGLTGAVRERRSLTTRQNAERTVEMLGSCRVAVVTCDWHLPRATRLFTACGFEVVGVPAVSPSRGIAVRLWRWGRERVATALNGL